MDRFLRSTARKVDGQLVDSRDSKALFALRRKMGMLFQHGALFTDLSVFENRFSFA